MNKLLLFKYWFKSILNRIYKKINPDNLYKFDQESILWKKYDTKQISLDFYREEIDKIWK